MAAFLSYRGAIVGHDIGIECRKFDDFVAKLSGGGMVGTCETGAMIAWNLIRHCMPGVRLVTVRRPRSEVIASLERFGFSDLEDEMARRDAQLDIIGGLTGTLNLTFKELANQSSCRKLFEFCLGEPFDRAWWARMAAENIQVNMQDRVRRLHTNYPHIEALKKEIAQRQAKLSGGAPCPALH